MKDVAEAAGVSTETVSRAFNNKAGVSENVARRIQLLAGQMGYRPNPLVRAFHNGKSQLVGFCFPYGDFGHVLYSKVLSGASNVLIKNGYYPVILASNMKVKGLDASFKAIHEGYNTPQKLGAVLG